VLVGEVLMMTGPGDETAGTGGRGRLRGSHADREQVIDVLKAAFVQGRLTKDEFDLRVGQVLASRTYADLAALTAGIPAGAAVQPLRPATQALGTWRAWCYQHRRALGLVACGVIPLALWVAYISTGNNDFWAPTLVAFFVAIFTAGGIAATAPEQKNARWQLPRGPAPGVAGQAAQRPAPAAGTGQLPQIDQAPRRQAEAAPRRLRRRAVGGPENGWPQPGRAH
jgi:Domain of unknown function (DUF1707)